MKILVTGGAGFIGSALIRHIIAERQDDHVLNLDKLTYAGTLTSLPGLERHPRYRFVKGDIADRALVAGLLREFAPEVVIHLAAESHVDRSIDGPGAFIETNVVGTYSLLETTVAYWKTLEGEAKERFRFHHVSTDEVFGSLGETGFFTEETAYSPRSPYSASKAASDHLVMAWHHTFDLPVVLTNCSNNYGPHQFPEKLIPLMIIKALAGETLPVYGKGDNVRDWLFVDDHVRALCAVFDKGRVGETYNVGGNAERTNLTVVNTICGILDRLRPRADGQSYAKQIGFVTDRRGHDRRYAIDAAKIRRELGWEPRESFDSGMAATVAWYLDNEAWWRALTAQRYAGQRLGLAG